MSPTRSGKFVNVVASLDFTTGQGNILYVNPSSVASDDTALRAAAGPAPAYGSYELSFQDEAGQELRRVHPAIQLSACEPGETPQSGLISEDVPFVPGTKRIVLLHDGQEVSRFEAGTSSRHTAASAVTVGVGADATAAEASVAPAPRTLALERPAHLEAHKRRLMVSGAPSPEQGVSYTVQVRPQGSTIWQTIAVSQRTPEVQVDENQFPGVEQARIRILRSTGLEDELFAESVVKLGSAGSQE